MRQLYFLIFFIISPLLWCLVTASTTHPKDIEALKDLKSRFDANSITPGSCLSSWDFSVDPCDNLFSAHFTCGLRCDLVLSGLSRVTEITLDSAGYSGSLASINWDFPYLHTLELSGNSLSGSLPDSLARLTHLRRLSLSKNSFSSQIPTSIGNLPLLEELFLDNNQFVGSIPLTFNKLSHLKRLEVQQNQLSGVFPFMGSIKTLLFLDASGNSFSSFGTNLLSLPKSLISLSIRNNRLSGDMPRNFLHMNNLEVLDLSYNQLVGPIIGEVFQHPSLQQLSLSHNHFSALERPRGKAKRGNRLVAIDLSYNKINGLLPKFLAGLPGLSALSLEDNRFTGMIPAGYVRRVATASFQRLLLGGNYLFGPIPGPLKRLKAGSANVSLVDNCLNTCSGSFFFCQGGDQKSLLQCKKLRHSVP